MRKNSAATRARRNVEKQSSGIYVSPILVYSKLWWIFVLPKPSFLTIMYASSRFALSFVLVPSCYECYPVYLSLFFFISLFTIIVRIGLYAGGGSKGRSWRTKPHPCARRSCFVFRMWKKCTNFKIYQMNWIIVPINVTLQQTNKQLASMRLSWSVLFWFAVFAGLELKELEEKGKEHKRSFRSKTV